MNSFQVFGLILSSEIDLPELKPAPPGSIPDAFIRFGDTPERLTDARFSGTMFQAQPGAVLIDIPGIARYLSLGGQEIIITNSPGWNEADVRHFLLTTSLISLLLQRGFLVLHGATVIRNASALSLLGVSKSGKSTLSAGFAQRGYPVITDEVTAVRKYPDSKYWVEPGRPAIQLWPHTLEELETEVQKTFRVHEKLEKVALPLGNSFSDAPFPLENIIVLDRGSTPGSQIKRLEGQDKFRKIHEHTSFLRLIDGLDLNRSHFELVSAVASQSNVYLLQYPFEGSSVSELIDLIEQSIPTRQ